MNVKLTFIDENVINVKLAMPNSFSSLILAPCHMELELAQVIHFVVAVVWATKDFVQF